MNLLVTGGSGFIGTNLIRKLLADEGLGIGRIVNIDACTYAANQEPVSTDPRYFFVKGNISDDAMVRTWLEVSEIDAVINLAAETHVDRSISSPEPFFETNVMGTMRLLESVKAYWQTLEEPKRRAFRFLHVSTDEVYGTLGPTEAPWTEDSPFRPNSPYAASKAASDHLVRAYYQTYGLPTITTNCSNNYGPFQNREKLIPKTILNALEGKPIPIYGDGQQIRDWLYVDDHCEAIWLALTKGRVGETYNVGGHASMTNFDAVSHVCIKLDHLMPKKDGTSYVSQMDYVGDRPGHDRRYAINSSKITEKLGWNQKTGLGQGILQTIEWYLQQYENTKH